MKLLIRILTITAILSLFAGVGLGFAAVEEGTLVAQWGLNEDDDFKEAWDAKGDPMTAEGDIVQQVSDSPESWNRFWFNFNDGFYFHIFKPLAQGYSYIIPERPRGWVENFFTNLMYPVRFVNCLLQGKFESAGLETSKFIANTFIGLGGLGDVTEGRKVLREIPTDSEDFGQTLGAWGADNGTYLVWPFIGPSTARDSVGLVGDYFLTPATYINPWYASMAVKSYEKLNYISLRIGEYETLKEGALDPYVALKSAYLRMRAKKVSK
ncbi:MAG: VacJ family lipoprotein [Proteobacteria bacterium]|nr:VacJ family lipoprotein [Pseudomonadota bacterium]MBU1610713.1 VacJ family lipoprotein [Pseudomonadota bacterium]